MCVTPITLPNGQEVGCRNCNRCRDNRIKDWVGRCISESRTAVATHSITWTYAPIEVDGVKIDRHERTAVLTYSDIQKYFKVLRKAGYRFRYFVCGEFGKQKGRAHWHGIVFWYKRELTQKQRKRIMKMPPAEAQEWLQDVPPHVIGTNEKGDPLRFNDTRWKHGHQVWDNPSYKAVKYVCKYIQKDMGDDQAQGKLTMSKEPALGGFYFRQLAQDYVDKGIAPKGPFYRHPEAKKQDGTPIEFYMRGVTSDQFREAYVAAYFRKYPGTHLKNSEYVEEWLDRQSDDWRSSEKLERLERAAVLRREMEETEERKRYAEEHDRYYFGKNKRGFYDLDWNPDEQEIEPEPDATSYLSYLYATFDARDQAQHRADIRQYGGRLHTPTGGIPEADQGGGAHGKPHGEDGANDSRKAEQRAYTRAAFQTNPTVGKLHAVDSFKKEPPKTTGPTQHLQKN